jgi:N-acetylglutamate synthase-like GNAT family acetyltransferase
MILKCEQSDFQDILDIINDGASAYKGIIPGDLWHDPYMSEEELKNQLEEGVEFWKYLENGKVLGVMGIQDRRDVTLIRHAYVRTTKRKKGIGTKLLTHLCTIAPTPILIGTWKDASWAIRFYVKHGFRVLDNEAIVQQLRKYWKISDRQIETSVVLASADWK